MSIEEIYLEEALNTVTNWLAEDLYYEPPYFVEEEIKVIKTALEKQIAKKQETTDSPFEPYACPTCHHSFDCDEEYYLGNGEWFYCGKCGQKIDWSKE